MGRHSLWPRIAALCLCLFSTNAWSSIVTFEVTNLGETTWRYDYTLVNDTLGVPVSEFTIYFGGAYANLKSPTGPAPWDLLVVQPDPNLPDEGFFDGAVFEIGDALAPGATLGGFSIQFDFLASRVPGAQRFEFLDFDTFEVLAEGLTTPPSSPPVSVPEPSALYLLACGLLGLGWLRRHRVTTGARQLS